MREGELSPIAAEGPRVAGDVPLPRSSSWLIRLFRRYVRRYIRRHFGAVRLSRSGAGPRLPDGPVAVVLNHPSWWDPLIGLVLSELFAGRSHYAPMDAAALEQYRFFNRLGFFGVERGSVRGARDFFRISRAILDRPDSVLWITAQGRFADARDRPVRLAPGLGHLLARASRGTVVPLAIELVYWDGRLPEVLAYFGAPIAVEAGIAATRWTARVERALQAAQDALAAEARRRDPAAFRVLLAGNTGMGSVYDWWRRARWLPAGRPDRMRPAARDMHSPAG